MSDCHLEFEDYDINNNRKDIMTETDYPGIDYTPPGSTTNRDSDTGIRYGIMPQGELNPDVANDIGDNSWTDVGFEQAVEEAKSALVKALDTDDPKESLRQAISDYVRDDRIDERIEDILELNEDPRFINKDKAWEVVSEDFSDSASFGESGPFRLEEGGVVVQTQRDSMDLWVFKSPFYTYAQFCSPCAPGACHLSHPLSEEALRPPQNKCYCLGHDWFEDNKAPYQVFRVDNNEEVPSA